MKKVVAVLSIAAIYAILLARRNDVRRLREGRRQRTSPRSATHSKEPGLTFCSPHFGWPMRPFLGLLLMPASPPG